MMNRMRNEAEIERTDKAVNNGVNVAGGQKCNDRIGVVVQAFYGNRTYTEIDVEEIDYLIQGILDREVCGLDHEVNRSVVRIPGSQCVLVYNRFQEEDALEQNKKYFAEAGYVAKPLAIVPEEGLEIFSRCLVCRMDENGGFASVEAEDWEVIGKYLAV